MPLLSSIIGMSDYFEIFVVFAGIQKGKLSSDIAYSLNISEVVKVVYPFICIEHIELHLQIGSAKTL